MDSGSVSFAGTLQEAKDNEKCCQYFTASDPIPGEGRRASLLRNKKASDHWSLLRNIRRVRPLNPCDSFEEASSRRSVSKSIQTNVHHFFNPLSIKLSIRLSGPVSSEVVT